MTNHAGLNPPQTAEPFTDAKPVFGGALATRFTYALGEVKGYPETCAEPGLLRSTSSPASFLSGFFSIFFCKYARANSTGRSSARLKFCIFLKL